MRYKIPVLALFLLLIFNVCCARPYFGFGVGYTVKNIYTDIEGFVEDEKGVPLLGLGLGYGFNISIINLNLGTNMDFFCMDLIRGNREITLFVKPCVIASVPLRLKELSFSPLIGYGGIYKRRYIKESTYLKGENRYLNPANYERKNIELLFGGMISYSDWFIPSFYCVKDIAVFHTVTLLIRTPISELTTPYLNLTYTGGEETRTISLGLTFYK